jgi:hypothetical protein
MKLKDSHVGCAFNIFWVVIGGILNMSCATQLEDADFGRKNVSESRIEISVEVSLPKTLALGFDSRLRARLGNDICIDEIMERDKVALENRILVGEEKKKENLARLSYRCTGPAAMIFAGFGSIAERSLERREVPETAEGTKKEDGAASKEREIQVDFMVATVSGQCPYLTECKSGDGPKWSSSRRYCRCP